MNPLHHIAILAQAVPTDTSSILTGYFVVPFEVVGVIVGLVVAGTLAYYVRRNIDTPEK